MSVQDFTEKFKNYALEIENIYGIPFLVSLAVSALESGWLKKAPGNNMFGIKAGSSWTGKTITFLTSEYLTAEDVKKNNDNIKSISRQESGKYKVSIYQKFRAYDSYRDSFVDYGKLLKNNSRYKKAFTTNNESDFIKEVAKGGYSTSPTYSSSVIQVINIIKKNLKNHKKSLVVV